MKVIIKNFDTGEKLYNDNVAAIVNVRRNEYVVIFYDGKRTNVVLPWQIYDAMEE